MEVAGNANLSLDVWTAKRTETRFYKRGLDGNDVFGGGAKVETASERCRLKSNIITSCVHAAQFSHIKRRAHVDWL